MENIQRLDTNLVAIPKSAFFIEKMHKCSDCPVRQLAIKHPKSVFAGLHIWHKTWWPGWKAHQARACAFAAGAKA